MHTETDVCVCDRKEKEVPHRPIKRKRFETRVSWAVAVHCCISGGSGSGS